MQKEVKQDQKPEQIPFFEYYFMAPLRSIRRSIREHIVEEAQEIYYTLTGAWYCSHCEKYHGRRVYKNTKFDIRSFKGVVYVCSLGLTNNKEEETKSNDRADD